MIDWIKEKFSFTTKKNYRNDCVLPIYSTEKAIEPKHNSITITIHEKDIESQEYKYHSHYCAYHSPEQHIAMKMF